MGAAVDELAALAPTHPARPAAAIAIAVPESLVLMFVIIVIIPLVVWWPPAFSGRSAADHGGRYNAPEGGIQKPSVDGKPVFMINLK